jgi:hypothetical protein
VLGPNLFAKFFKILDRLNAVLPTLLLVGGDTGHGSAVTQNDDRRTALHLVEQLREMGFRDGGLNLANLTEFASLKERGFFTKTGSLSHQYALLIG